MNRLLDKKFYLREKRVQRIYEIDDELYEFLREASKIYKATISDIFNACIKELLESNNLQIYQSKKDILFPAHSFDVNESNVKGLGNLKKETTYNMNVLVSMAIRNVMEMEY